MKSVLRHRFVLFAGGVLLSALYFLCRHAYYVGFFEDDAFYVIGARSLLQGRYVYLNHPATPPILNYFPGYPLLLAVLTSFTAHSFLPYQLLSMVLMVSGFGFYWAYLKRGFEPSVIAAALVTSAVAPLTVSLSGALLSDIPLFAVTPLVLWQLERHWSTQKMRAWTKLSILSAFPFFIRPMGGALWVATFIALMAERRRKPALFVLVVGGGLILLYLFRNWIWGGHPLPLAAEYSDRLDWTSVSGRIYFYFYEFFYRQLYRWPVSFEGAGSVLAVILASGIMFLGFFSFPEYRTKKVALIYLFLYGMALIHWGRSWSRYLLAVFPLLSVAFFQGLWRIETRLRIKNGVLVGAMAALSVCLMMSPLRSILRASLYQETPLNTPERHTYAWIQNQTSSSDLLAAELDGRLYLYTGRKTLRLPSWTDMKTLSTWLEENHVRYIVQYDVGEYSSASSGGRAWAPFASSRLEDLAKHATGWEKVYENRFEKTAVYRISM